MILEIIKQFNWVDIVILIVLFRICYVAIEKGLIVELFKLLGVILATYVAMHYYTTLSDFVRERVGVKFIPLAFLDFIFFNLLAIIGYLIFFGLREAVHRIVKMETGFKLNKWGAVVLGIARGVFLSGLLCFILVISTIGYLKESVGKSFLGKRMLEVAPATYSKLWNGLMSKFMSTEKYNETILEVQRDFDNQ